MNHRVNPRFSVPISIPPVPFPCIRSLLPGSVVHLPGDAVFNLVRGFERKNPAGAYPWPDALAGFVLRALRCNRSRQQCAFTLDGGVRGEVERRDPDRQWPRRRTRSELVESDGL